MHLITFLSDLKYKKYIAKSKEPKKLYDMSQVCSQTLCVIVGYTNQCPKTSPKVTIL